MVVLRTRRVRSYPPLCNAAMTYSAPLWSALIYVAHREGNLVHSERTHGMGVGGERLLIGCESNSSPPWFGTSLHGLQVFLTPTFGGLALVERVDVHALDPSHRKVQPAG